MSVEVNTPPASEIVNVTTPANNERPVQVEVIYQKGDAGEDGNNGQNGKSAYEIDVENGFVGTEAQWLASLHGTDGEDGTNGTNGVGVPAGGTAGQILSKKTDSDYETEWVDNSGGGGGDYVDLESDQSINGDKTFVKDVNVNGLKVGRGGGNVASNTAVGNMALNSNTTGSFNVAIGYQSSFYQSYTGGHNTFVGSYAAISNNASSNTGVGSSVMYGITTGTGNTAIGVQALYNNKTGSYNIAIGYNAGPNSTNVGVSNKLYIGAFTGSDESKHIIMGDLSTRILRFPGYANEDGDLLYTTSDGTLGRLYRTQIIEDLPISDGSDIDTGKAYIETLTGIVKVKQ